MILTIIVAILAVLFLVSNPIGWICIPGVIGYYVGGGVGAVVGTFVGLMAIGLLAEIYD